MPGLLFVYSDPGAAVTDDEFNDWYDNEHVPLRLPIPGFRSWSRWAAADGQRPAYAAIYDLAAPAVVAEPPYADLAHTRSARETAILARIGLLDRRTYELREPVYPPKAGAALYVSVVEVDVQREAEEDFNRWYDEEHIPLLAEVPGWVRSRRFVLVDGGAIGQEKEALGAGGPPPKYLALHEWESPEALGREEFKAAVETEWTKRVAANATVFKGRFFKLLRTWEGK